MWRIWFHGGRCSKYLRACKPMQGCLRRCCSAECTVCRQVLCLFICVKIYCVWWYFSWSFAGETDSSWWHGRRQWLHQCQLHPGKSFYILELWHCSIYTNICTLWVCLWAAGWYWISGNKIMLRQLWSNYTGCRSRLVYSLSCARWCTEFTTVSVQLFVWCGSVGRDFVNKRRTAIGCYHKLCNSETADQVWRACVLARWPCCLESTSGNCPPGTDTTTLQDTFKNIFIERIFMTCWQML